MSNAKQVQLRGGTSEEHENFIGAPREITVDTTKNTIRVHDGLTVGGNKLATSAELNDINDTINSRIDDMQSNLGASHNHDSLYSRLNHNHDDIYERRIDGLSTLKSKHINGYCGLSCDNDDSNWVRTTRNGLIPYQSGGYSSLGTSSWKFNDGWFNRLNAHTVTVTKNGNASCIEFPASVNDPGFIRHVENNNTSGMYFSVSDDIANNDRFYFGGAPDGNFRATAHITTDGDLWLEKGLTQNNWTISVGGVQIYFNGSRPSNAPDGSISFG